MRATRTMSMLRTTSMTALLTLSSVGAAHAQDEPAQDPTEQQVTADAVVGLWSTEPNDDGEWSRVEVYACEDRYCGRIVWLSHPVYDEAGEWGQVGDAKVDWNNSEEELRSQPVIGLQLMHSFRLDDEKWKDGRIYDPDNGKTYRCELTLAEDGELLKVRGFVKIAFVSVGRTTEWTRFHGEEPGS